MNDNKINKKLIIIIAIVSLVLVLGIILVLVIKDDKPINEPSTGSDDNEFKHCGEVLDKDLETSNWKHNSLNYEIDQEGNRVNNSSKIKEEHQLEGGYTISDMTIISKKCKEVSAELNAKFTNNSAEDITFGSINFYFKNSETAKEVNVSLDVRNVKSGETIDLSTSYNFRIIDALDYRAVYIDSSQMAG